MSSQPAKILISACLLGEKVRYHGGAATCEHPLLEQWQQEGRLISLCPEVAAGMPTPRTPAEIIGTGGGKAVLEGSAKVKTRIGTDQTGQYLEAAKVTLAVVQEHQIRVAILKESSPSCGTSQIYDGEFFGQKTAGMGVVAALLEQNGIKTFNERQLEEAKDYLESLPKP